jgi:hypothetical protein
MSYLFYRLKEPSSHAGIGAIIIAVGQILEGDYATGIPAFLFGLAALLKQDGTAL